jgi:hypothetical protein
MNKLFYLLLLMGILFTPRLKGQDVEKLMKADSIVKNFVDTLLAKQPLVLSGRLNARTVLSAGNSKTTPFTYMVNANLNAEIFGYNMPISFSYTNRKFSHQFSSPIRLNQIKINPSYKWVKLHLGQSSLSYSPYTLAGMQFSGIGVELSPKGPLQGGFMWGRFFEPVDYNPEQPFVVPVFQRNGYAANLNYNINSVKIEVSFLESFDKVNSISLPADTLLPVSPQHNIAGSFKSSFTPFKAVSLDVEYAMSIINKGVDKQKYSLSAMLSNELPFVNKYSAWKLGVNFSPGKINSGLSIEHIDPGFVTHGAYYSRSDFQNITLNLGTNLFNNSVALNINGGIENDNLNDKKERGNTRMVGAANLGINLGPKLNLTATYSNFQSFTNMKNQFDYINTDDPFINIDTLRYSQVNQNANVNINYLIGEPQALNHNLGMSFALNGTGGEQGDQQQSANLMFNALARWAAANPNKGFTFNFTLNATLNSMETDRLLTWGPQLMGSKMLLENKMIISASAGINLTNSNGDFLNRNINLRSSCRYKLNDMHNFTADFAWLYKQRANSDAIANFSISLNYTLTLKKYNIFRPIRPVISNNEMNHQINN